MTSIYQFLCILTILLFNVSTHAEQDILPPQIPTTDFNWAGTFKVASFDPAVETDLTIRGKQQGEFFDIHMEQGKQNSGFWVENLIYQNHFYTVTHEWQPEVPDVAKKCVKTKNPITVDDLNGILKSARYVGLEKIEGDYLKHFRATCLSETKVRLEPPLDEIEIPVKLSIFSDLYTPAGAAGPLKRWLQFGDGVGLDTQQDEWFILNKHSSYSEAIYLPEACEEPLIIEQTPCRNLQ